DLNWERPLPLVRRRDCLGVRERAGYRGEVLEPLTPAALADLGRAVRASLARGNGQDQAIAVNFLFAYVRPEHERTVRDYLAGEFPGIPISVSHEVAPIWREYDRASTTIADAYVRPLMGRFIQTLDAGLRQRGLGHPWAVIKSNGGHMLASAAAERPVHTVLSGLSGGIIAGKFYGETVDDRNVITFDMGGTSTDVAVVVDGGIGYSTAWEIEFGLPIAAPFIDMTTMGAGGGSIAWINKGGMLQVGPQSAGAEPGPACYGKGGTDATVTDANVVLGRLNPQNFLGGEIELDPVQAQAAVAALGRRLNLDVAATARAIIDIANENIAEAMRLLTVRRGLDPRRFSLVAFGGAGPLHASAIAKTIGARRVIIPPHPGLCSAFGTLLADMRVDKTWTHILRSDDLHAAAIDARLRELVHEAAADLRQEGFAGEPIVQRSVNMRYLGQNYEEQIPIPAGPVSDDALRQVLAAFEDHYERTYGYRIPGETIELVQFNVTVIGITAKPVLQPVPERAPARPRTRRPVSVDAGGFFDVPIFHRDDLSPTDVLAGPAVIEELDSTTVLEPGQRLTVTPLGVGMVEWT
ncbi:MAG: hydantoinase/oxoprolinase family protein, partial [Actinobacteria bacterium]|nr:hydantoinase/oxoprolinase family protein [Actinomycetota bacterium]